MAKFRFKLAPVLRQRELAERDEQLRVAAIERRRIEIETQLRSQQQRIEAEEAALRAITRGGRSDASTLRWQGVALAAARSEAQRLAKTLAGVLRQLEQARAVLASKAAERRAIELLRERQLAAYHREQNTAETRMLDDLASAVAVAASRENDR